MKIKIFLIVLFLTASFYRLTAQITTPQSVKSAFVKEHPDVAAPKWEMEGGNFEANWKVSNVGHSALYSPAGKFISSETDIKPDDLPQSVKTYMAQHIHAKIKEASKNIDAQRTITYEADVKGKAYIFDANGSFIKTAEDD